jgi:hypothetical protein
VHLKLCKTPLSYLIMLCIRTCAQLSVIGAVLPLAARAANAGKQCPLSRAHPFASIRFSNPLFQSPWKSKTAVAAEPDSAAPQEAADASQNNVIAVYVTVPDLDQGMLSCSKKHHSVWCSRCLAPAAGCSISPGEIQPVSEAIAIFCSSTVHRWQHVIPCNA